MDNFNLIQEKNSSTDYKTVIIPKFSLSVGKNILFTDTSLKVVYQHRYGLLGKNGIGKSSLLKHIFERKFNINKSLDILYVNQEEKSSEISVIDVILGTNTLRQNLIIQRNDIIERLELDETEKENILEQLKDVDDQWISMKFDRDPSQIRKILFGLGFSEKEYNYPVSSFSGGWRRRISIAKALYMKPTLLLLDEPTNHLDLNATIWLTSYLSTWDKTLIVVSHDQNLLSEICTDIMTIESGKLCYYTGSYKMYEKALKEKTKKYQKEWTKLQKKINKMRKQSKTKKEVQNVIKKSGMIKPEKEYIVKLRIQQIPEEFEGKPLVRANKISFGYKKTGTLFDNVDFTIFPKTRAVIVGANGVGKSTFMKLLMQQISPQKGHITHGTKRIGWYHQHFDEILPQDKNPVEYLFSVNETLSISDIRKHLGMAGLGGQIHLNKISTLSGGQKARVTFVSLIIQDPYILFLDEPTNHLDIETINGLIDMINNFNGAVVFVSHDCNLIYETNSDIYICANKSITKFDGDYEDYSDKIMSEIEKIE